MAQSWYEARLDHVKANKEPILELARVIRLKNQLSNDDGREKEKEKEKENVENEKEIKNEKENRGGEADEVEKLFMVMLRFDLGGDMMDYIRILNLSGNHLDSFFEEICDLKVLESLDMSCNRIEYIPCQIGQMGSLKSLNMRNNLLTTLPVELGNEKRNINRC